MEKQKAQCGRWGWGTPKGRDNKMVEQKAQKDGINKPWYVSNFHKCKSINVSS